jgi:hypothetical protein
LEGITLEGYLVEDAESLLGSEAFEVLLTGSDDQSSHIESSRRDDILFVALGIITVGTMLRTWEHHREEILIATPGHDIHHRLGVHLRHSIVETTEELFVAILRTATDQ